MASLTNEISKERTKIVSSMIKLVFKEDLSWEIFATMLDQMSSSLSNSKQIITILLQEMKDLHERTLCSENEKITCDQQNISLDFETNTTDLEEDIQETQRNQSDLEGDIIEAVRNIETQSDDIEEDESVLLQSTSEEEPLYTFVEIKNDNENQDGNKDLEDQLNEIPEIDDQIDSVLQENSFQERIESDKDGNRSNTETSKKVIKLKILPQPKKKNLQCNFCAKCFQSSSYLQIHEMIHTGEKPFQCNTCQKRFAGKYMLLRHSRIHSGVKPYQCKTCMKCFNDVGNFKKHKRIHTPENMYDCKKCGKHFKELNQFKVHERIHDSSLEKQGSSGTGSKQYQCSICQKCFTWSSHLIRHKRIHSDEKPYRCKTCAKRFRENSKLKIHERIHTDNKPYQCKNCEKCFRQSSNLRVHEKQCKA